MIAETFENPRARGSSGNRAWAMPAGWCIVNAPADTRRGSWAMHWEGSSDPDPNYHVEELPVTPGERVLAYVFAKRKQGSAATGRVRVVWLDDAGSQISVTSGSGVTSGTYGQSRLLQPAPAGAVTASVELDVSGTGGAAHEFFFDDVLAQVVTQESDVSWGGLFDDGGKPDDYAGNSDFARFFSDSSQPIFQGETNSFAEVSGLSRTRNANFGTSVIGGEIIRLDEPGDYVVSMRLVTGPDGAGIPIAMSCWDRPSGGSLSRTAGSLTTMRSDGGEVTAETEVYVSASAANHQVQFRKWVNTSQATATFEEFVALIYRLRE